MRRYLTIMFTIVFVLVSFPVGAAPPDYCGGVNNEYEYQEIVFLSGEPIKFTGKLTVSNREKTDKRTVNYKFTLTPEDKTIKGKLDRKVNYEINYTKWNDKGQTTAQDTVKSYSETVTIGSDKYVLDDYQFSKGDIIDNRPASDFYSGTLTARKYYKINKTEGEAIVEISGGDVGYENFWGSTETQLINYTITVHTQKKDEEEKTQAVSWQGTVSVQVSDSMTKTLKYMENEAAYSSFPGGHVRITSQQMVSRYDYDLPRVYEGKVRDSVRNRGNMQLNASMTPRVERLIVPKFRDTAGHWAENDINQLYSLDVFEGNSSFFLADIPMTRVDFTRAVVKAAAMRTENTTTRKKPSRKEKPQSPFKDVAATDVNFEFIKQAVDKGIISGVAPDLFGAQSNLTRAQAITILIRALGFEGRAPSPGYATFFADDRSIPGWARDSIYMAAEIGLVRGDNANRINPDQVMTRAEASAMLVKFLNFLEVDLQRDYRENIVLYN